MKPNILNTLFILSFLISGSVYAQTENKDSVKVYNIVEEMPIFPGGIIELTTFLKKNIKYPKKAFRKNISGKVYITFIVDKNGNVVEPKILRGIGGGCDEEALRVISMMPKWVPGKQNGDAVNVQFNLPINFNLN